MPQVLATHVLSSGFYIRACYFGCVNGATKSVQVLLSGIEAVMVLPLIILKWRALHIAGWVPATFWLGASQLRRLREGDSLCRSPSCMGPPSGFSNSRTEKFGANSSVLKRGSPFILVTVGNVHYMYIHIYIYNVPR